MAHPWVTKNGKHPLENEEFVGTFEVTQEDINKAITPIISLRATINIMVKFKRKAKIAKRAIKKKMTLVSMNRDQLNKLQKT